MRKTIVIEIPDGRDASVARARVESALEIAEVELVAWDHEAQDATPDAFRRGDYIAADAHEDELLSGLSRKGGFEFPPLGPTGEGPVSEAAQGEVYWQPEPYTGYFVTHQHDRPAVAFRCHYPGGSSPCDKETADRWIAWAAER